jgi:hypothetical protein
LIDTEVARRREAMAKERTDTAENLAWLAEYEKAARKKLTDEMITEIVKGGQEETLADLREQKKALDAKVAGDQEIARLDEQLARIEREHETSEQRIEALYNADVAKFDAAEEKKTLVAFSGNAARTAIMQQFDAIRKGLLDKEQMDLHALYNSQGWRGIFGEEFTQDIRRNEELMKEWATSSNQSLLMVKVALESMKEMSQKAFEQMAQGMGAGIAHAMIYEKSIGAAMKAAMVSTLESLGGQAYAHAIYSLALGFLDLATGDEAGAVAAFEAAALFGAVGTAAAMIGRAMGPGTSGGAGGGSGSGAPSQTSQQASASRDQQLGAVGAPGGASGPHVTVNVWGHVVGDFGSWGTLRHAERCGNEPGQHTDGHEYDDGKAGAAVTSEDPQKSVSGYIVFMLSSRGTADTKLQQILCETPEAAAALRGRAERLKANWGTEAGGARLVIGGLPVGDSGGGPLTG